MKIGLTLQSAQSSVGKMSEYLQHCYKSKDSVTNKGCRYKINLMKYATHICAWCGLEYIGKWQLSDQLGRINIEPGECIIVLAHKLTHVPVTCSTFFRIGAKHQELREKQARCLVDYAAGTIGSLHDMDDDEMDKYLQSFPGPANSSLGINTSGATPNALCISAEWQTTAQLRSGPNWPCISIKVAATGDGMSPVCWLYRSSNYLI